MRVTGCRSRNRIARTEFALFRIANLRARVLVCAAIGVILVATQVAPASAAAQDEAQNAVEAQLNMLVDGQAGRLWKSLHPAQQALIPQDRYVACATKKTAGIELKDLQVQDVYKETATIPGTEVKAKGYAVTVRYTLQRGPLSQANTDTFHEYKVGRKWRFTVPDPTAAITC